MRKIQNSVKFIGHSLKIRFTDPKTGQKSLLDVPRIFKSRHEAHVFAARKHPGGLPLIFGLRVNDTPLEGHRKEGATSVK